MLLWLLLIGGVFTLGLLVLAFSGPSAGKALKRRMESVKERHGENVLTANANAQIRKLMAARESRGLGNQWAWSLSRVDARR